jgi:starch synthase
MVLSPLSAALVSHYDPVNEAGTGYCFDRYEPLDLFTCMIRAWEGFRFKPQWQELQKRGMSQNFSWYESAKEYDKLYKSIYGLPAEEPTPEPQLVLTEAKGKS